MKFDKQQLNYIKAVTKQIQALQDEEEQKYQLMLETLKVTDNDWLFDVCFSKADIESLKNIK